MKVTLKPGAELDILTQGEFENSLAAALSGFARPAQTVRDFAAFKLDGSGNSVITGSPTNVAVRVLEVEQGYTFALHRLVITVEGYTAGVPYTSAGFYIEIHRAGRVVDTYAVQLPAVVSYGSDAPIFNNGEHVAVLINTGPASKAVIVDVQGTLETLAGELTIS